MKKAIILLALIFAYNAQITEEELTSPAHNWEIIKKINSDPSSTWRAGVNEKFKSATLGDTVKLLGAILTPESELKEVLPVMYHETDSIPDSYDARDAFPNCDTLSHLVDQSACGSCWANASAAVMSDRICIQSNQSIHTKVSAADLMSCCHACSPPFKTGCGGGFIYQAFLYWGYAGIVSGGNNGDNSTCKPYPFPKCEHHSQGPYPACPKQEYPTPACVKSCQKDYTKAYSDDKSHGTAYRISSDEAQIRAEIVKNGPVVAGFEVYADFVNYKSGVYEHKEGKKLGGHAVRIIGFGEENQNGTKVPYWLVANSWNETWGDKGYFKIIRGKNDCGFESEIVAGNPTGSSSELKFLQ